jgi:hypothetical protein
MPFSFSLVGDLRRLLVVEVMWSRKEGKVTLSRGMGFCSDAVVTFFKVSSRYSP